MPTPAYWQAKVFYGPGRSFWIQESEQFTGVDAEDNARTWLENALASAWEFTVEAPHENEGAEITVPVSAINYVQLRYIEAVE